MYKYVFSTFILVFLSFTLLALTTDKEETIPIWFPEYGIEIVSSKNLRDTLSYNKSSKENFKFRFSDTKGKCYCERYINGKLYEKGMYESSLDTLKRYVSTRWSNRSSSAITVQKFFQPLKDGKWIIYKGGKANRIEVYELGVKRTQ
jgi:hypothetical protein